MSSRKTVLLSIYLYLVCLVAVIAFVIAAANMIWGGVRIALPKLTIYEQEYKSISSFEYYKNSRPVGKTAEGDSTASVISDERLRRLWEEEKHLTLDAERRAGLRVMIQAGIWVVIVVPIYIFHWRAARKLKDPTPEPIESPS